jgi:hypothetical protein
MGQFVHQARLGEALLPGVFTAGSGALPGGLAMATIAACACFAAVSGSSLATAATLGMGGPAADEALPATMTGWPPAPWPPCGHSGDPDSPEHGHGGLRDLDGAAIGDPLLRRGAPRPPAVAASSCSTFTAGSVFRARLGPRGAALSLREGLAPCGTGGDSWASFAGGGRALRGVVSPPPMAAGVGDGGALLLTALRDRSVRLVHCFVPPAGEPP